MTRPPASSGTTETGPTDGAVARRIAEGRCGDPFAWLGPHEVAGAILLRVFQPDAIRVAALIAGGTHPLGCLDDVAGMFCGPIPAAASYRLRAEGADGTVWEWDDPYRFAPVLGEMDEYLLAEGSHQRLWQVLGAHPRVHQGVQGTSFAVWAPNASRVSVVGDFNGWDGRRTPMRRRGSVGIWEIFLPGLGEGTVYKYELRDRDGGLLPLKADPVGFGSEHPPANASVVRDISGYGWSDADWRTARAARNGRQAPISIYEVHLPSWKRRVAEGNRPISYREAADELVTYVRDMGFTHIELLPISEYPFDGSWGYQPVGLFAPTIRHGPPHEFRDLVDAAHRAGIGLILDWVPGHFPTDAHGLGRFDGTALYEHADPREGFHQDWNTLIYNFGRTEVRNFLVSNALYWLEEYHADGLRVDAVASMLYRDYSRGPGEWVPNIDGERENYEAIDLLRRMNTLVYGQQPGILTVAEESTAFPGVSRPVENDGLGFGFKWNMGWMHDTLAYIGRDPLYRRHHHHQMTFGLHYAFSENFILPISHDEVVHGKGSMLARMPGQGAERFANLRAYYGFMWGHPGKKLLFMGQEFAQAAEWDFDGSLDWAAADRAPHAGVQALVRDLNRLYAACPALHHHDCDPAGFQWIEASDAERSIFAWIRWAEAGEVPVVVLCNFTPIERPGLRIGLPAAGAWREILNTDARTYGGEGRGNMGQILAQDQPSHGQPASATLYLPPLSCIMLTPADTAC
ncbi:MAG: 1,4-alpha-glucan branching protein GlgB [Qingshengfaniella sp.]